MEEPAESWATRRYGARRVASPARKNQNSAPRCAGGVHWPWVASCLLCIPERHPVRLLGCMQKPTVVWDYAMPETRPF